jgi:ferredoxin
VAHVVTEPCVGCKYTDCVVNCPMECFYADGRQLYIDPEECIDCDACVEACPVDACFAEDQLPNEWERYIEVNAAYFKNAGSS